MLYIHVKEVKYNIYYEIHSISFFFKFTIMFLSDGLVLEEFAGKRPNEIVLKYTENMKNRKLETINHQTNDQDDGRYTRREGRHITPFFRPTTHFFVWHCLDFFVVFNKIIIYEFLATSFCLK